MSTVAFVSKKPAGSPGIFNYEYTCTCSSGPKKPNVIVTSSNDNAARMLAQLECDDTCGEARSTRPDIADMELADPISITNVQDAETGVVNVTADQVFIGPSTVSARNFSCVSFFAAGVGKVGIRNNCAECKVAVVMWANVGVHNYRVPGYGQIIVQTVSNHGQLIGEQPC